MGQDVFESDVLRDVFVCEDKVFAYQLADWCRPLDVWVFLVIGDELSYYGCCEGFGGAACVE
jgi:hypothetical protein